MRRPFFRKQTQSWYLQDGKRQINLGPDRDQAFREYHRIALDGVQGAGEDVRSILRAYVRFVRSNRADATYRKVKNHLRPFAEYLGRMKIAQLRPYHVQTWLDREYGERSPTYRNSILTTIKGCFSWAEEQGYCRNPIAKMRKPSAEIREFFVPSADWPKLLDAVTDEAGKDFVGFMLSTGARAEEMPKIEASQYDAESRRIILPMARSKGKKRQRVIYLDAAATEIVERLTERYPTGPLFRNRNGRPWTKDSVNDRFKRLKRRLGWPELTATSLRHSYCVHLLNSGVDSGLAAKLMGHTDSRMVLTRYGHLDKNSELLAKTINQVANPLSAQQSDRGTGERRSA